MTAVQIRVSGLSFVFDMKYNKQMFKLCMNCLTISCNEFTFTKNINVDVQKSRRNDTGPVQSTWLRKKSNCVPDYIDLRRQEGLPRPFHTPGGIKSHSHVW